ncbi:translation initiation factor IF-2-like [Meles meles]|uniref:translation initiation factor IF-2-like n=1 Tax=Meles meles TaxID=9662 RepID=UPI001E69F85B|nr:translation initiation factor IF-2-like [Meles meles]
MTHIFQLLVNVITKTPPQRRGRRRSPRPADSAGGLGAPWDPPSPPASGSDRSSRLAPGQSPGREDARSWNSPRWRREDGVGRLGRQRRGVSLPRRAPAPVTALAQAPASSLQASGRAAGGAEERSGPRSLAAVERASHLPLWARFSSSVHLGTIAGGPYSSPSPLQLWPRTHPFPAFDHKCWWKNMPGTSPRSHFIMDLLLRSKNPFEGEPGGGRKDFQEISSSGRKIHKKLMEAPMADLCLLTKEQLFWPGGRTIASRSFQRPQTQDSEPLALLPTSAGNTTINLLLPKPGTLLCQERPLMGRDLEF